MTQNRTGVWGFVLDNYLLLVLGTVIALVWANTDHDSYERIAHLLHFPVNEVGMVFFFALATKEIVESTLPGGALATRREAAVPVLAAAGGMVFPAGLFALQAMLGRPELLRGWAIPCATDIAFSYMAARMIFPKQHPAIPFLLLLAIADDAFGLILLALFYPTGPLSLPLFAGLMIPALAVAYTLRRRLITNFWIYTVLAGGLSWTALYLGGIHPALAMVPIIPFMPHEKRDLGLFSERERGLPDTMNRFHDWWHVPVQVILLLFGLTNAGVTFANIGSGSWMVFSSLLLGKPLGILIFTMLGVAFGLRAPGGIRMWDTILLGVTAGIGFTVALFFSTAAFPPGLLLDEVKMGALLSFLAFPAAVLLGRVGRFVQRMAASRA